VFYSNLAATDPEFTQSQSAADKRIIQFPARFFTFFAFFCIKIFEQALTVKQKAALEPTTVQLTQAKMHHL